MLERAPSESARPRPAPARAAFAPLTWRGALADRVFRVELVASAAAVGLGLALLARFLAWVELRPGAVLADPVLERYAGRDVAGVTFVLIYGGILFALSVLLRHPERLVRTLQSYLVLIGMRALLMSVTPLAPPEGAVPLHDPIVNCFVPGEDLTRDLMFSGHTSILVLLALCVGAGWPRAVLLVAATLVGGLMLVQKAHYTIDVLVAPLASWSAYSLVKGLRSALLGGPPRSARSTRL